MKKLYINDDLLIQVLDLIKSDNKASKSTLASILKVSRATIDRAITKLKLLGYIKTKKRIGIVEQYQVITQIVKKD
jgi:Mn-dependent DtxR family transcriptional regulator